MTQVAAAACRYWGMNHRARLDALIGTNFGYCAPSANALLRLMLKISEERRLTTVGALIQCAP